MARDQLTLWSATREPEYRRLSRSYALPGGVERIYCYHVRKTGGTSLHLSFLGLGGEDPLEVQRRIERSSLHRTTSGHYAFVAHQRNLLAQGHYFYGWSHLPAHRLTLPPRTFTMTILRDPLERVVSYYNYLRQGDAPGMAYPVGELERSLTSRGFGAFLDVVPKANLLSQLSMFSPTFDVPAATERIVGCSWVMFTDEYESGLSALAQKLSLALAPRRDRATKVVKDLPVPEGDRLREMLDPEYQMLAEVRTRLRQLHSA
jgi:hypothetical protein